MYNSKVLFFIYNMPERCRENMFFIFSDDGLIKQRKQEVKFCVSSLIIICALLLSVVYYSKTELTVAPLYPERHEIQGHARASLISTATFTTS